MRITNRLDEAQGLILEELERQYGGQTEASAAVMTALINKNA